MSKSRMRSFLHKSSVVSSFSHECLGMWLLELRLELEHLQQESHSLHSVAPSLLPFRPAVKPHLHRSRAVRYPVEFSTFSFLYLVLSGMSMANNLPLPPNRVREQTRPVRTLFRDSCRRAFFVTIRASIFSKSFWAAMIIRTDISRGNI